MRKVTLVGKVALASAAFLVLAAPSEAEARARGFRLRFGIGGAEAATPASLPARPPERVATAATPLVFAPVTVSGAPRQPDLRTTRSETGEAVAATAVGAPTRETAKPAAQPVRVAGPWCRSQRIVGAGAGFCEVN